MKRAAVCFGGKSALEILRVVGTGGLVAPKGKGRALPDRVPHAAELRALVEEVEAACPGLRLERPVHVVARSVANCRGTQLAQPRACTRPLSGGSLLRLGDHVLVCSPGLAFVQMATREKDRMSLLELGWELCGSYRGPRSSSQPAYQVDPLVTVRALRAYAARNPSLDGALKATWALSYVADGSASPRETKLALVLGLPMMYGGEGLGIPRMNHAVIASKAARAIAGRKTFRCDLCWPEAKLDVEYQSREHHEGETSRLRDSRRANALAAMGWSVVGITNDELDSLVATCAIADSLRRHLGKRKRTRVPDYHARRLKLRRQLGLPVGYD